MEKDPAWPSATSRFSSEIARPARCDRRPGAFGPDDADHPPGRDRPLAIRSRRSSSPRGACPAHGGRLPYFTAMAEGRVIRAHLETAAPMTRCARFAYEEHLADLAAEPPRWPESTRRISQLRVTVTYTPLGALRRALGPARLNIDSSIIRASGCSICPPRAHLRHVVGGSNDSCRSAGACGARARHGSPSCAVLLRRRPRTSRWP